MAVADMARGNRSFVQAAIDAALRIRARLVDMGYFAARDRKPAEYCVEQVREADVYIGIIGFRYGSLVPGQEISYTELEFRTATDLGIPRLVFLLADGLRPPGDADDTDRARSEDFRRRLQNEYDLIISWFTTPDKLEAVVYQALAELEKDTAPKRTVSTAPVAKPWMVPPLPMSAVKRPKLMSRILESLQSSGDGSRIQPGLTVLEGPGGFGKTTLAAEACRETIVSDLYPGGVLWESVGRDTTGAGVTAIIGSLCELLSGEANQYSDSHVASARLGTLLDEREPTLLVVDDVWHSTQLAPFLVGGRRCHRLITTRSAGVVPRRVKSVFVEQMTELEAEETLTRGLDLGATPWIESLVDRTSRWPILLDILNATLNEQIESGADADEAARWVLGRLHEAGPTAFDRDDDSTSVDDSRRHAVEATMAASLALLEDNRERFLDFALFPEKVHVPAWALAFVWKSIAGLSADRAERLRARLIRLRLVTGRWVNGRPSVILHGVLRDYATYALSADALLERQVQLVRSAAHLVGGGEPDSIPPLPWWKLPDEADYLWSYLPYHLNCAGMASAMDALVCDLRWIVAKVERYGSTIRSEFDLQLSSSDAADLLRRVLVQSAHVLTAVPSDAVGPSLASRLDAEPVLRAEVQALRQSLPKPRLTPIWQLPDLPDPVQVRVLPVNDARGAGCVAFHPDGIEVAVGAGDGSVHVIELETFVEKFAFERVPPSAQRSIHVAVWDISYSPDGQLLAVAAGDGRALELEVRMLPNAVEIWDLEQGAVHARLTGPVGDINSTAFSPDGRYVACGGEDCLLHVWERAEGDFMHFATFRGHEDRSSGIWKVAFSADSQFLASAGADGYLQVWRVADKSDYIRVRVSQAANRAPRDFSDRTWMKTDVRCVAFSPDGSLIATCGNDSLVRLWTRQGALVATLTGHKGYVRAVAFSADGRLVASAGDTGNEIRIWNCQSGDLAGVIKGHSSWIGSLSSSGNLLASASMDGTVRLWNVAELLAHPVGEGAESATRLQNINCVAVTSNGEIIATGDNNGGVSIWTVELGRPVMASEGYGWVYGVSFSHDSQLLAFTTDGKHTYFTVQVWPLFAEDSPRVLKGHQAGVEGVAFAPGGYTLASVATDGLLVLWNVEQHSGRVLGWRRGKAFSSIAFAPNGETVITGAYDNSLNLWTISAEEQEPRSLDGHTEAVLCVAISPDGETLASGSRDKSIRLWTLPSGVLSQVITGHTTSVTGTAFSPNGRFLASVSRDRTIRIWDARSGEYVCALGVGGELSDVVWLPDGTRLCAVGEGGLYLLGFDT
jgi:WD40 repeat protein